MSKDEKAEREHCEALAGDWCTGLDLWGHATDLADLIARERAAARREALEDAACLVEDEGTTGLLTPSNIRAFAKRIRALKENP